MPDLNELPINWLVGKTPRQKKPVVPFDSVRCEFLIELSARLFRNKNIRLFADLAAFAFWCRRQNIENKKSEFGDLSARLGLGLAFHIAPGNVPVNCAFSFAFGLLSGNSNIVRLPSAEYLQIDMLCTETNKLLADSKFEEIASSNALVRYDSKGDITKTLSGISDLRMIWGSDEMVAEVRKYDVNPRCVDLVFSDRYSFSVISLKSIRDCTDRDLDAVIERFYNDTYLFDQNACSAARLIIWYGVEIGTERERFWDRLYKYVESRYVMSLSLAVEKYGRLYSDSIGGDTIARARRQGSLVYRVEWNQLPREAERYSGRGGYFYEWVTNDLSDIIVVGSRKSQTLTYFGMEKEELKAVVIDNQLSGIDRIVPIGQGLEMDLTWDGYDLIRSMSRCIAIR